MTAASRHAARRLLGLVLGAASAANGGCLAYRVVSAPVKVAATAVVVTGETATAAVKATGKVTVSAIQAAGKLGSGGVDASARLAEAGMVTFVDVATGTIVRVPWHEGMTLAAAGAEARVEWARRTVDVVRAGAIVLSSAQPPSAARVAPGDVIRVRG